MKDDYRKIGLPDEEVYNLAMQLKRLIVTYNAKDFRRFARKSKNTGVIGVPALMPYYHIDNKLTSLLTNSSPNALQGKYTALSGLSNVA